VATLILWGARDRWVPVTDAYRFKDDIKTTTLKVFDKLGHDPMEEDPVATAAAVAAFLKPIPSSFQLRTGPLEVGAQARQVTCGDLVAGCADPERH
jgi:hypothetical protein